MNNMNKSLYTLLLKLRHQFYSNTWQTIIVVFFIVFSSVGLSLWLFWRSLYLPELKNHANYLASELNFINQTHKRWADDPSTLKWLEQQSRLKITRNPEHFPDVTDKLLVDSITDVLSSEVERELGRSVQVYFKFKPIPMLWIQDSEHPEIWLSEPITYYSHYSPGLLFSFSFGLPLLTLLTIFILVRGLNRPLRKLERAANSYITEGHATTLPTRKGPREIRQVNTAFNQLFTTLNQAQKERTIMLAGISHDLRTPLTRMRLTAEMLPDEFFREGLVYDIEDMDAILEQFISFMKDGSDEPVRPTNLSGIFKEVMVQFGDVRFICDQCLKTEVPVRPLSIKRLVINLVNNAIRYGKEPIHLSAYTEVKDTSDVNDTPHPMLIISVKDEGDGVAEDQLARIMQPFERGESARTTQGSGLGLAIVDRIARLHQGTVSVTNHPDGGLQASVSIPLLTQITGKSKDVGKGPTP
ncbi:ATP-binding protein [Moraxella nasovis]|uniref:ATP-binding protein n=1 Tax=Moraxella nasovis TaxID=2904121 RepID=UPI001F625B72|nr:ATP-binding protein [Moraxella nasovis]UNU73884.1 ATP-binding protein [Moraxella nasovis]